MPGQVDWALTEKGKRMPLDAELVTNGNLEVVGYEGDVPIVAYVTPEAGVERAGSHFVTCPQQGQWRK